MLAAEHDPGADGTVVDLAGGTGHHLSAVLDVSPHRHGLRVDASSPAVRRAARVHLRVAAIGADMWSPLPVRTGVASVVLTVFGPRNIAKMTLVLWPGGIVLVATPHPDAPTGACPARRRRWLDPYKPDRLAASFEGFERLAHQEVTWRVACIARTCTTSPLWGRLPGT